MSKTQYDAWFDHWKAVLDVHKREMEHLRNNLGRIERGEKPYTIESDPLLPPLNQD